MGRRWRFAAAVLLVAAVAGGSDGLPASPAGRLAGWFAVLDRQVRAAPPGDDVLQLDLAAPCGLVDGLSVGGRSLSYVGAGTARYGQGGQGYRYQCAFTGDEATDRPANARLEVVGLADDAELVRYRDLLATGPPRERVRSAGYDVDVAEVLPPPSGSRTFDAEVLLDEHHGAVRLLLEVTDPTLAGGFDAAQVAEVLTGATGPARRTQ
jgi:hypothetical protein